MRGRGVQLPCGSDLCLVSRPGLGIERVALRLEIVIDGVTRELASGLGPDET